MKGNSLTYLHAYIHKGNTKKTNAMIETVTMQNKKGQLCKTVLHFVVVTTNSQ